MMIVVLGQNCITLPFSTHLAVLSKKISVQNCFLIFLVELVKKATKMILLCNLMIHPKFAMLLRCLSLMILEMEIGTPLFLLVVGLSQVIFIEEQVLCLNSLPLLIIIFINIDSTNKCISSWYQQYLKYYRPFKDIPIFERFPILICVTIVWIYAVILTTGGAYSHRPTRTHITTKRLPHNKFITNLNQDLS